MRARCLLRLFPLLLLVAACSDESLSLFFDIPPPTAEELAAQAAEEQAALAQTAAPAATPKEEGVPPAIETVLVWDQAAEMLPKDDLDEVDWVAALREGVIKPRADIAGPGRPKDHLFRWDFYFPGPDPSMDAYFPHSVHTEWVDCQSCHIKIFPYRELEVTMDQILEGQYCGVCHGVVAFSLDNCARCHLTMF